MSTDISQKVAYLRSLPAIRERCSKVHALATQNKLEYFDYHPEKESEAVDFCLRIIKVRWRLFVHVLPSKYLISHKTTARLRNKLRLSQ